MDTQKPEDTLGPLGPPELPGSAPKIQLISSAKSTQSELAQGDELEDDELNEHVEDPGDPDGVHAAEEKRKWQESHPAPAVTPSANYKRRHPFLKALLILIIIAALAAGAYWFGDRQASAPPAKQAQTTQTQAQKQAANTATTATKHYDSATYTLGFDYPTTWTVTDNATKLTVVSPSMQLPLSNGTKKSGQVIVTFQNQQTTIPGYPVNGATADLLSDKLTYKQPTSIQRAQTYLSYLSYTANKTDDLDAIFVTGDNGYQQGQTVPLSDIVKGNPLISVTFGTCADPSCATGTVTPLTVEAGSWQTTSVSKDITALLQSITLN